MREFFSQPHNFSFKDLLAIVFSGSFLYYAYCALTSDKALDLVDTMVPLIGIILGGYFGQEAIQAWKNTEPMLKNRGQRKVNYVTIIEEKYKWNGDLSPRKETDYIVLHHADASQCTAQDIHRWHLSRGWTGIGYHYFARKDGTVYRGRPRDVIGAHTQGHNSICAEGDYELETMSLAQLKAIAELVAELKTIYPKVGIRSYRLLLAQALGIR
ncbi:N-acetylmuramoyl-L-alanine amidase [Desulforamulus aeronauticus]|uniref:N-acetylmuramoyl-L-alanine amidase n=1 Tax=Desulforamulus aeronauticus DSM 10349 TaxID=1121421 RepID=A0A1M6WS99_9FIRM|nr:N-acetylmuramoyl-L-alanine amidase [Desulforamulus aeronauticus]SHK96642.1 N-acetylmuramoyl-L-alanine amidase [Desulforamulus aeronauticus DSM 10349]